MKDNPIVPVAITKQEFIDEVTTLVFEDGLKYSQAIVEICDRLEIEYEDIVKLVNATPIKGKLEQEAIKHNVLPKKKTNSGLGAFL